MILRTANCEKRNEILIGFGEARSLAHDPTAAGGRRRRRRVSVVFVQHIRDRLAALAHCTAVLRPRQRDPSSLGSARPECSLHRDALLRRHAPRRLHTGTADRLTDGARPKTDVARRDRREMDLVDNFGTSDVDNLQIRHSYGGLTSSSVDIKVYICSTVYSKWRRNIMLRLWVFVCHDRLALMGRPGDTPRVVPN